MSRRHVREGRDRIGRQERLLATLQRDGHSRTAERASDLLNEMRRFQAEAETTLADLEKSSSAQSGGGSGRRPSQTP